MILTRLPRCGSGNTLPIRSVAAAPHIVVENTARLRWRVVGAAAQDPDVVFQNNAPADRPAWRPRQIVGDLCPLRAIGGIPSVAMVNQFCGSKLRYRLSRHDPNSPI